MSNLFYVQQCYSDNDVYENAFNNSVEEENA